MQIIFYIGTAAFCESMHIRSGVRPCPIRSHAMSDPGSGHVRSGVRPCPIRVAFLILVSLCFVLFFSCLPYVFYCFLMFSLLVLLFFLYCVPYDFYGFLIISILFSSMSLCALCFLKSVDAFSGISDCFHYVFCCVSSLYFYFYSISLCSLLFLILVSLRFVFVFACFPYIFDCSLLFSYWFYVFFFYIVFLMLSNVF